MDESAIDSLLLDKLTYSTSITDRMLSIAVCDLSPEAYMDRLGFTQEEKDWASLLCSVLAEEQNITREDTDGDGYYNTDYGDISFGSGAEIQVVYYNQTDARWGNKLYRKSGTIGKAGCGPTALAIAVATLTGNPVTPYDVAQWSVANGHRCEGSGTGAEQRRQSISNGERRRLTWNLKELIFGGSTAGVADRGGAYAGSIQAWLPIRDIVQGVVHTRDRRFIKILELLPVNF